MKTEQIITIKNTISENDPDSTEIDTDADKTSPDDDADYTKNVNKEVKQEVPDKTTDFDKDNK